MSQLNRGAEGRSMNAEPLHFWVSISDAGPMAVLAAFLKCADADIWAKAHTSMHAGTLAVWCCTGTAPPVRLSAYRAGKATA